MARVRFLASDWRTSVSRLFISFRMLTLFTGRFQYRHEMDATPKAPTPKSLLREAIAEPSQHVRKLGAYGLVINTLAEKGFSYANIAKWLSDRLKDDIRRGQVYYVHQNWLGERQVKQSRAALEQMALEEMTGSDELGKMEPELSTFLQEAEDRRMDQEAHAKDARRGNRKQRKGS